MISRSRAVALLFSLAAASCSAPDAGPWRGLERKSTEEYGGFTGYVTDAETGRPISGAQLESGGTGHAFSDSAGRYYLADSGFRLEDSIFVRDTHRVQLRVVRRGYAVARVPADGGKREIDTVNVALRRMEPVRFRPHGRWLARFGPLDSAGFCPDRRERLLRRGSRVPVEGTVTLSPWMRPLVPSELEYERNQHVWSVLGYMKLDVGALWLNRPGTLKPDTPDPRILGGWPWSTRWPVVGWVTDGDSLDFTILPYGSHFGMIFHGRLRGDSVVGRWSEAEQSDCYPSGPAVLRKER